mmetsp:Transcript_108273/g.345795  ORF Transcript_108273/g.345795 Transcript_108273/m.345795 type:complete len:344 (+) Transcript_108273:49-1080(+)
MRAEMIRGARMSLTFVVAAMSVALAWHAAGLSGFVVALGPSRLPISSAGPRSAAGAGLEPGRSPGAAASGAAFAAGALAAAAAARARFAGASGAASRLRAGLGRTGTNALMPWKIPNSTQWQWLSVRELMLRERILFVNEYLDENYANATIAMLLYLQSEDATKPIQIYFAAPGAALKPALALYDTMSQLKGKGCKITTVSYSLCAGMGAFLMSAGSPGRRFATPNVLFLMSNASLESPFQGQATDIEIETRQMIRECTRVEEEWAKNTKQSVEKIRKDLRRDFYLSAEKAVEYGLIDRMLVPNVDKGKQLDKGIRDPWSGTMTKAQVGFGEFADPNQPRTAV